MNKEIDITNTIIKTERLVLRPFKEEDLNDLFEYAKVPGVGEMAGWKHHKSIDETKEILDSFINGKKTFAITLDNKVIGSIGVETYNEDFLPELKNLEAREIGYVLSKAYWGQGIMTEVVKAVCKYLFYKVGLDVIVCGYYTFNERSKRVQEKIGFKQYKIDKDHYNSANASYVDVVYNLLYKHKATNL